MPWDHPHYTPSIDGNSIPKVSTGIYQPDIGELSRPDVEADITLLSLSCRSSWAVKPSRQPACIARIDRFYRHYHEKRSQSMYLATLKL